MNKNDFFREATLRICGTLNLEKAISSELDYLKDFIPIERMFLQILDSEQKEMRIISTATLKESKRVEWNIPLSEMALKEIEKFAEEYRNEDSDFIWLFTEDLLKYQLVKEIAEFMKIKPTSLISLPLGMKDKMLVGGGSLIFLTEGENKFTREHAELLSILKEPFAIAMSNSLKHLSDIKLHERNFFWEATRRIAGNLDIEKSMHSLLQYLNTVMPANRIYLQYYDETLQSIRTIAKADLEGGRTVDEITPLADDSLAMNREVPLDRDTFLITNPEEFPVSRDMMKFHDADGSSIILLVIRSGDEILGFLVLQSVGEPKFTEHDLEHIESIKEPMVIAMSNVLKHREVIKLKDLIADDNKFLQSELRRLSGDEIIGSNFGLKDVMRKVQQVAGLDSPVLLLGETGVGKDLVANAVHYSSPRYKKPFITVNCGAIPPSLIDSELFGHEKGAFTGALERKRGRFERANGGTIFLDEIGELPPEAQVRLLRVLQNKEIERVGGIETISLDIRIIAATNRNLEEMVTNKEFREDLWFRLNVFPIEIPPLRERVSDIPALIDYFIREKSKELKLPGIPALGRGIIENLKSYGWPGNVRELQNLVERELILSPRGPLLFKNIETSFNVDASTDLTLDELNKRYIIKVLENTDGVIHGKNGAAQILGINANTLRHRMAKLGIEYKKS